ncbi:hypothetical protein PENTCL1PPCAC_9646, partial [Pristionchus entomophagus]
SLLKLGDRFQIQWVMDQVEKGLMDCCYVFTRIEMLKIADDYKLFGLKMRYLGLLKTVKDFVAIEWSTERFIHWEGRYATRAPANRWDVPEWRCPSTILSRMR